MVREMWEEFTNEFYETFKEGIDLYEEGIWDEAKDALEWALLTRNGKDNPSSKIIEEMEHYHFEAPHDWDGARNFEGGH